MTAERPTEPVSLDVLLEHRAWVRALARSLVRDEHRAEDVEQETWRMAIERPPRDATSLRAWFGSVVRNAARTAGRRATSRARLEAAARTPAEPPAPGDVVAEAEVQHKLVAAVLALDEPYRATVLHRYFEGMEAKEIATRTGVPVETVRTRVKRAIERLRDRMGVELGDDRQAWCLLVFGRRSAPSPTGAAVIGAAGGVAMGALTKTAIVATVLVIGAAAWWTSAPTDSRDGRPEASDSARETASLPTSSPKPAHSATPDSDTTSATGTSGPIPAPVDLDHCDRSRHLHGVVVRRDGSPVGGADVVTVSQPWRKTYLLNARDWFATVEGPRTRTAANGTFALPLQRGTTVALRVDAPDLAAVEVPDRQAGERVRVVLDPAVRLRVTVLDEVNHVIAGVKLRVWTRGGSTDPARSPDRDVVAGDDGAALVDGLAAGSHAFVEVLSDGYGDPPRGETQLAGAGETEFRMVLPPARILRGSVVDDATGVPIANARVGLSWFMEHPATTGADGRFALPARQNEPHVMREIAAVADGYAQTAQGTGAGTEYDFRLRRGFEATGRVLDVEGRPLRGALVDVAGSVRVKDDSRSSSGCATTDAEGRFHVTGLDPTIPHVLVVVADGHGILRQLVELRPGAMTVDIGDVVPPTAHLLAGRVLDAAGEPAAGASIEIYGPAAPEGTVLGENHFGANAERVTDDLGRFAFADLAAGEYDVFAQIESAPQLRASVVVPAEGDAVDVTMKAAPASGVEVRVVDDRGDPVADADVLAVQSDDSFLHAKTDRHGVALLQVTTARADVAVDTTFATRRFLECKQQRWTAGVTSLAFTVREGVSVDGLVLDPEGTLVGGAVLRLASPNGVSDSVTGDSMGRFRGVVPKGTKVRIELDAIDGPGSSALSGVVECEAPATGVVLRCERIASDRALTVKVTTPDGVAVAGVEVDLRTLTGREGRTVKTDEQGVARFDGLPALPRLVTADESGPWARSVDTTVTPNGQQIVVVLRPAAEVCGAIVDADGTPAHATVMAFIDDDVLAVAKAADDGRFVLHVPADARGPFRVAANDGAKPPRTGEADGVAPGATEVRIVMPR